MSARRGWDAGKNLLFFCLDIFLALYRWTFVRTFASLAHIVFRIKETNYPVSKSIGNYECVWHFYLLVMFALDRPLTFNSVQTHTSTTNIVSFHPEFRFIIIPSIQLFSLLSSVYACALYIFCRCTHKQTTHCTENMLGGYIFELQGKWIRENLQKYYLFQFYFDVARFIYKQINRVWDVKSLLGSCGNLFKWYL